MSILKLSIRDNGLLEDASTLDMRKGFELFQKTTSWSV